MTIREPSESKKENTISTPEAPPKTNFEQIQNYISIYNSIAVSEMEEYGIPASITLAQGILESSMGLGRLAKEGNNHFGIKCHKNWKGKRIYHDDDRKGECFRVYKNPNQSFRDHSLFLTERSRYAFLFDFKSNDFKAWAKGLKKAGYATDSKYPQKLISLIERFDLDQYDNMKTKGIKRNKETAVSQIHTVRKGDTLYSLAKKYNISVPQIIQVNKIKDNTIYLGQELAIPNPFK